MVEVIQIATMLRRPPTGIELKLDDITEYEEMREQLNKEKQGSKPLQLPPWQPGPKGKLEVYARVGYTPMDQQPSPQPGNQRQNCL
ncbi:unnamed protein product [Acanthoscelides obtectus]|uniref:Cell division cycle protein 26 homolog n=1 Tax=Acanthoscelides obtectus TaxID=200917 RepID=A0A9P0JRN8_ACAOB|nr:unnamed protein product [Acanthoscelides obtectus]CAK1679019.1 hypothetical protein AOBTE_LOCUS32093 [Acanthoscelides obtectus]